ncbi:MAG: 1,4-alpha-glucan branching protein domain-containing protein [Chthoniobacterales bacterium]
MRKGKFVLLLHAHLPYVRHPEYPDFLEEDWLYEAIVESYVPLLRMFKKLSDEGSPVKLTMSITPTLCAMLEDPLLQDRAARHIGRCVALAESELRRTEGDVAQNALAGFYLERFREVQVYFDACHRRLIPSFRALQEAGFLEIITSAATHGFLPLMAEHPEAVRAQIRIACDYHRACFGRDPSGMWLPECAYFPGLEKYLKEAEIKWFVLDAHGLMFGRPQPRFAIYGPCYTPDGPAAFARDRDSSRQVWSADEGYPGDPAYRDFYRDAGYDLELDYLRQFLGSDGQRKCTGMKYRRITGKTEHKELYNRSQAEAAAESHATDFLAKRLRQFEPLCAAMPVDPVVLSPYDAELFGHWWFEGPEFLDLFLRKATDNQKVFEFITPSGYLENSDVLQVVEPCSSSWGDKGYWNVWLDQANAWIYPHLHAAARRMTELARRHARTRAVWRRETLGQMARELLLAQASDWAFLMRTGTAHNYAVRRTKDHLLRFNRLCENLQNNRQDPDFLAACAERDNIFPDIEWRYYI